MQSSANQPLAATTAIVVLALVAVALVLVRRAVHPIRTLAGVISALAKDEHNLDIPYAKRTDEPGDLAKAIEALRRDAIGQSRMEADRWRRSQIFVNR